MSGCTHFGPQAATQLGKQMQGRRKALQLVRINLAGCPIQVSGGEGARSQRLCVLAAQGVVHVAALPSLEQRPAHKRHAALNAHGGLAALRRQRVCAFKGSQAPNCVCHVIHRTLGWRA